MINEPIFIEEKNNGRFYAYREDGQKLFEVVTFSEDTPEEDIEEMGYARLTDFFHHIDTRAIFLSKEELFVKTTSVEKQEWKSGS